MRQAFIQVQAALPARFHFGEIDGRHPSGDDHFQPVKWQLQQTTQHFVQLRASDLRIRIDRVLEVVQQHDPAAAQKNL